MQTTLLKLNQITTPEAKRLARIHLSVAPFMKPSDAARGAALAEVRDGRLYKDTYKTFQDYHESRLHLTNWQVNMLLRAAGAPPNQRLKRLRSSSPAEVSVVMFLATTEPRILESALHRQFSDKRVRGEWFALTDDDLNSIREEHKEKVQQ